MNLKGANLKKQKIAFFFLLAFFIFLFPISNIEASRHSRSSGNSARPQPSQAPARSAPVQQAPAPRAYTPPPALKISVTAPVAAPVKSFFQSVVGVIKNTTQSVVNVAKDVVKAIANTVKNISQAVVGIAKTVPAIAKNVSKNVAQFSISIAGNGVQLVTSIFGNSSKPLTDQKISTTEVEKTKITQSLQKTQQQILSNNTKQKASVSGNKQIIYSSNSVKSLSTDTTKTQQSQIMSQPRPEGYGRGLNATIITKKSSADVANVFKTKFVQYAPYFDPKYPWTERIYIRKEKDFFQEMLISNNFQHKDISIWDTLGDLDRSNLIKKLQFSDSQEIEDFSIETLFNFLKSSSVKAYTGKYTKLGNERIAYFYDKQTKLLVLIEIGTGKFIKSFTNIESQIKITKK
ncbi:MAG: hypothetical protein AAB693_01865 [Patescibacteria group bacterium]